MTRYKVELGVEENNVTCKPAVLHAKPKDEIVFRSSTQFSIQAKGISPLQKADFQGDGDDQEGYTATALVRDNAEPGSYSFACAIFAGNKIYMDASCPGTMIDW